MLPEGWETRRLDEVIVLGSGDSRPKDTLPDKSEDRPYPVYGGNGVMGFSRHTNNEGATIVIGRVGEYCGTTRLIDHPAWITDNALRTIKIADGFDPAFTELALKKFNLRQLRNKGGQPLVSQKPIYGVALPFPKLSEQGRIVEAISTWDQAIETVDKLIDNARAQKKALMQQLLTGKRRLPGFEGAWETVRLGELGAISSAGVDKKIVEGEKAVRLLNFLDAYNREFICSADLNHEVTAPTTKVQQCNVLKGDIFFTPSSETRNDIGHAAVAVEDMPGVVYSYHVVRLRPVKPIDLTFSAFIFQTDHFRRQTYKAGDGSGQRYVVSQNMFRQMDVPYPPLSEQKAIGEVLNTSSIEIERLQANRLALQTEKRALMQLLLTGKRRVKVEAAA
ncbi:restriction endonuclease subunit S [Maricaulis maris]|uniref:restriction endonuclease subunit S n=1 Tax=Maricaulis maris TaxID=74318 RepID=UPI0026EEE03D|nr:restriction endonuclease subunit S [Maricaulis maris]